MQDFLKSDLAPYSLVAIVFMFAVARIVSGKFGLNRYFRRKRQLDNRASLLLSFYTAGNNLFSAASGEVDGVPYRVYLTTPAKQTGVDTQIMDSGAVIYAFELDFNTQAHIVGLGREASTEALQLKSYFNSCKMEQVTLEGDFNKHFDMFAAHGQQTKARYLFDPEAMQSYMKYCAYNFWEIVGDEMYMVIGANHNKSSIVLENTKKFIDEIKPALIRTLPGDDPVHHESSYGVYKGPQLKCPLCSSGMDLQKNVHVCPQGHGVLMFGRELIKLRHDKLELDLPESEHTQHGDITCPNCGNTMTQSNYQGSSTVLDTCTNCVFRWVDSNELPKIRS